MPNTITTSTGVTLSRDAFIAHYVAAFMAANCVKRYWQDASTADEHQGAEDAVFCAEAAWEQIEETNP